jgi:hypothetical protein
MPHIIVIQKRHQFALGCPKARVAGRSRTPARPADHGDTRGAGPPEPLQHPRRFAGTAVINDDELLRLALLGEDAAHRLGQQPGAVVGGKDDADA